MKVILELLFQKGGTNGPIFSLKALIAVDSRPSRAYMQVSEISAEISAFVDQVIKKLHAESVDFRNMAHIILYCSELTTASFQ